MEISYAKEARVSFAAQVQVLRAALLVGTRSHLQTARTLPQQRDSDYSRTLDPSTKRAGHQEDNHVLVAEQRPIR